MKRIVVTVLLFFGLVACTATPSLPTIAVVPSPTETVTLTAMPVPSPTLEPRWEIVAEGLAADPSWLSEEVRQGYDVVMTEGALVVTADPASYAYIINVVGPRLVVEGDFGLQFEMEAANAEVASLSLHAALAQGEWWQGIRRLDIGLQQGKVAVGYWDGNSPSPIIWRQFSAPGIYANKKISLGLRKLGEEFIILVDGREVGRMSDPGLVSSGTVYLGINVAPGNRLTLYSLSIEANGGTGVTVQE